MARGRDRVPYGSPGNNRRPGYGARARYPWRTWLASGQTLELAEGEDYSDLRQLKQAVANKVWRVNRLLAGRGAPGFVKHRWTGASELTFYWFEDEARHRAGEDSPFPPQVVDMFAAQNMSHEDMVAHRASRRAAVPQRAWDDLASAPQPAPAPVPAPAPAAQQPQPAAWPQPAPTPEQRVAELGDPLTDWAAPE